MQTQSQRSKTRLQRVLERVGSTIQQDFAILTCGLVNDPNVGMIVRTANAFGVKEVLVLGSDSWIKSKACQTEKFTRIKHFKTPETVLAYIFANEYNLVCVEQTPSSVDLRKVVYPAKPVFALGNESIGMDGVIQNFAKISVEIPMIGATPSLNVAVSAGIVMFDYFSKANK